MKTNLIFTFLLLFAVQINAQTLDKKIDNLLELDGTIRNIQNLINQTIDYQKQHYFGISDQYWETLENNVTKKSLSQLKTLVKPVYSKNYTESEIDELITFYSSQTGKLIIEKQPIILEQLNLPLRQWSQDLDNYIIEEIENRGNKETTSEQIEKFESEFKEKYGLQILNLTDFAIDQENNIGDLLIDFGKTNGDVDLTKIITIKNNSDKEIILEEPTFVKNKAIKFDIGNGPLKVGETRDLKVILLANEAENKNYSVSRINTSDGNTIYFGIKYEAPIKEIGYEISDKKLKFKKFNNDFSKTYLFKLKNTGTKQFHISDITIDKQIAYLNWNKETLNSNDETEIRVVFSKELIELQKTSNSTLNLKVDLTKGEAGGFSNFVNETIELTIE